MEIGELIVKTPGTCGGSARIAGKRIPVRSIYRWFVSGVDPEGILEKYIGVNLAKIYAAITYALANRDEIDMELKEEDLLAEQARVLQPAEA
jgi:uncharacterized protein (DUF433 family)